MIFLDITIFSSEFSTDYDFFYKKITSNEDKAFLAEVYTILKFI